MQLYGHALLLALFTCLIATPASAQNDTPNIVIILCDDMGYGDAQCYNTDSIIPTPNIDALAQQGMRFTDAHTPSAVCTPTRYGLLTGRYCWRTRLKRGVLNGYSNHLIAPDRSTIGDLAQAANYQTACIGKWHLGMDLPRTEAGGNNIDYDGQITNGPNAVGFDYFYGITASLDFAPYIYIEDDRITQPATGISPQFGFPGYRRRGPIAENFNHQEALDHIADLACGYITEQSQSDSPFLLYIPFTAPHKPVIPTEDFQGRSGIGPYGDFVMQTDAVIGKVTQALRDAGIEENTLVILTSDNGSFMHNLDADTCPPNITRSAAQGDHADNNSVEAYRAEHHRANAWLRGTKADIWEGGHRVPFIVRWPGVVEPGSEQAAAVSLVDIYATIADLLNQPMPENAGEDSATLLPLLQGNDDQWQRGSIVMHSIGGTFAIRQGKWKLIFSNGSGGRGIPQGRPFEGPYQLYDMDQDPSETNNLVEQHPELVEELTALLEQYRSSGRSR